MNVINVDLLASTPTLRPPIQSQVTEQIDSFNIIVLKVMKGYRLHQLLSSLLIAIERSEEEKSKNMASFCSNVTVC